MFTRIVLVLVCSLFISGSHATDSTPLLPLRSNLGDFHRTVSTGNTLAQRYFDQGFALYFGFNHEAAIASFKQAAVLDTMLAMAWWGQSISAGPNINNPFMDSAAAHNAWIAVSKAIELSRYASPVERKLINALSHRYTWPVPEDRRSLDVAYADAMREVWREFPNDADVGALFADAMMNLRPWDLWSADGKPRPETPEIVSTIEKVLELQPDHPGACHFYIHTMEASPWPEKALPAADRLRNRIPGAGHLVHMPSHIDIRLGHYANAILANQKGIGADSAFLDQGGFYTLYRAHNFHFLAYAAMFDGQRALALKAARDMIAQIPIEVVREYADFLDGFMAVPIHVMVRFGMWNDILAEPKPPEDLVATTAFWHYGRTVALASLRRTQEAMNELQALKQSYKAVPETRYIGNNPVGTILNVGLPLAEGEVEYRRGNYDKAFRLLRQAVQQDDSLRYDEPWGWMMPVRHALGALLLERGRLKEAEDVYREDLRIHPDNGWALRGLMECLQRMKRAEEAAALEARFKEVWSRSDIRITASCFCRIGS